MHKLPKVTVVTVTYNAEKYLEQTIKSVIEQDYQNIEYIIIDGASTDGTIDIIKKYEKYIDYSISEPDSGIYDAMNKGIDAATGEWINFMNAGDSFTQSSCLTSAFLQCKHNTELLCGDTYLIYDTKKVLQKANGISEFLLDGPPCNHQSLIVKTTLMKKYKFSLEYLCSSDFNFFMTCYKNNHLFQFINLAIANYKVGGYSWENKNILFSERVKIILRNTPKGFDISNLKLIESLYKSSDNYLKSRKINFSKNYSHLFDYIIQIDKQYNNIGVYGYGSIGKMIGKVLNCKNIIYFDKNYKALNTQNVYHPTSINNFQIECLIISTIGREEEINKYLSSLVLDDKIKIIELNF